MPAVAWSRRSSALDGVTPVAVEWFEESGALHYAKHVEDLCDFLGEGTE